MTSIVVVGKLRFGAFQLDPARRELRRGGVLLSLPPKSFDCIAYLAAHRDRAVGRDELIAAVWGRAEVTDNLLDQVMLRARRAIDDTAGERRVIRTVPRFGYAWVAPTEAADDPEAIEPIGASGPEHAVAERSHAAAPSRHDASPSDSPARRRRRWAYGAALLLIVAVLAGGLLRLRESPSEIGAGETQASRPMPVLLLPVTVSADPKFAWARLGAMDLIADRLRAAGQPMVPSDNVVALARGLSDAPDENDLDALTRATDAKMVLKASAEHSAGYWRVAVQSIRGRDPPLIAESESQDLMEAARAAADRAARALGLTPPADDDLMPPRERMLAGVLRQVEAALLADQPDTARALLDTLDAEQSARPEVRFRRASIDFISGRFDEAQSVFEALLESVSAKDDPLFRARLLNGLGNIALRRDDYAASERYTDAAITLLGDAKPSLELGRAHTGRAISRSAQYRFDAALTDFAAARVVLESVNDRLGVARVDANLGILDARRDRFAEALTVLDRSADRLADFHDLTSELFARVAAAYAHLYLLDPAVALAGVARLRELIAREPNPQWKRYAGLAVAEVLYANGKLAEARTELHAVVEDAVRADDAAMLGSARIVSARFALDAGNAVDARDAAGGVLRSSWKAETPREQAIAWLVLVRASIAQGAARDAAAAAETARAWADDSGALAARIYADLAAAEVAAATDAADTAVEAFERALVAADGGRVPDDLLRVCTAYTEYLIRTHDLERAGKVAARVAGWADRSYEAALLQATLYRALDQAGPLRAALVRVRNLAGERTIPVELASADAR